MAPYIPSSIGRKAASCPEPVSGQIPIALHYSGKVITLAATPLNSGMLIPMGAP